MESSAAEAKRPHARRHWILRRMGELRGVVRSGRPTFVTMMQAARCEERYNLSLFRPLDGSRFGRVFLQSQVGSAPVIVGKVGFEYLEGEGGDREEVDGHHAAEVVVVKGLPLPEQAEAVAVPSEDGIGLNHQNVRFPGVPALGKPGPKGAVQGR